MILIFKEDNEKGAIDFEQWLNKVKKVPSFKDSESLNYMPYFTMREALDGFKFVFDLRNETDEDLLKEAVKRADDTIEEETANEYINNLIHG